MRLAYHRFLLAQLLLAAVATTSNAFVVVDATTSSHSCTTADMQRRSNRPVSIALLSASTASNDSMMNQLADVTFTVSVKKPMGIIFGENPRPILGLVVDDVSPGLNGGAAGLRDGDQLVAVNGQVAVGRDFDAVMSLLQQDNSPFLKLTMFRGSATDLYTILQSRLGGGGELQDLFEPPEEDVVVIDENYEAPRVVFENAQEKPLTVGSVLNIFKTAGSNKKEEDGGKKKQGMFGGMFGGETIQLDGNDASSVK